MVHWSVNVVVDGACTAWTTRIELLRPQFSRGAIVCSRIRPPFQRLAKLLQYCADFRGAGAARSMMGRRETLHPSRSVKSPPSLRGGGSAPPSSSLQRRRVDAEPSEIERRQEQERQQGRDGQAAHHRHRPRPPTPPHPDPHPPH